MCRLRARRRELNPNPDRLHTAASCLRRGRFSTPDFCLLDLIPLFLTVEQQSEQADGAERQRGEGRDLVRERGLRIRVVLMRTPRCSHAVHESCNADTDRGCAGDLCCFACRCRGCECARGLCCAGKWCGHEWSPPNCFGWAEVTAPLAERCFCAGREEQAGRHPVEPGVILHSIPEVDVSIRDIAQLVVTREDAEVDAGRFLFCNWIAQVVEFAGH